jgi:hypothetical protein
MKQKKQKTIWQQERENRYKRSTGIIPLNSEKNIDMLIQNCHRLA